VEKWPFKRSVLAYMEDADAGFSFIISVKEIMLYPAFVYLSVNSFA